MNNILTLRGNKFIQEKRNGGGGPIKLSNNLIVKLSRLKDLHESLIKVKKTWGDNKIIDGVLVSVYYDRIIAKSNRINGYLNGGTNFEPTHTVVGAKFNSDKTKHIITHYISRDILDKTITISSQIIALFQQSFPNGELTTQAFNDPKTFDHLQYDDYPFKKNTFKQ